MQTVSTHTILQDITNLLRNLTSSLPVAPGRSHDHASNVALVLRVAPTCYAEVLYVTVICMIADRLTTFSPLFRSESSAKPIRAINTALSINGFLLITLY